ncbi:MULTISPECIES: hypothetical protein [unclassified Streptomyces]|uniref:hypothetical protein n=1 Tax=unclassified Streptomyces TaxID=2593676 RepID=UPI001F1C6419|nr:MULTISPECIES: hypothetical protein [unclassified Streptomyces]
MTGIVLAVAAVPVSGGASLALGAASIRADQGSLALDGASTGTMLTTGILDAAAVGTGYGADEFASGATKWGIKAGYAGGVLGVNESGITESE